MIRIAIDGPGGAGKSSVAKMVAKELGIIYVDTGALYRTIGLYMLGRNISPKDSAAVVAALPDFTLELKFLDGRQVILLNGEDVGDTIRTPEVSMAASAVSAIKEVREYLLNTQRDIAAKNSVIMDGRDIGTVILPNAEVKIFLTASPEARAKRRYEELKAKGQDVSYEQVFSEMAERDKNDSTRDIAPCVPAKDATLLDNSDLTLEGTKNAIIKLVKKKTDYTKNYNRVTKTFGAPVRFFQRLRPVGLENIPSEGGLILCANHIAVRDPILIAAVCKRPIRFVAKKELFSVPLLGGLIKKLGAIKLNRGGGDIAAIKTTISAAKGGEAVAIFPQGHRYPGVNPATTPIKNGAALVAYKSGCDVLPVCIKVKKCKYGFLRRKEIIFGKPIKNSELGFVSGSSDEYKAAGEKIFTEIVKLGGYDVLPAPKEETKS